MKILHVAVFNPRSTNVWQAQGFRELGHEVVCYDYRNRAAKLGSIRKRDVELVEKCREESPDMILYSKCNKMGVEVLVECRKIGTNVMWYMDGVNNFDSEFMSKLHHCDFVFCSVKECVDRAKFYCKNSYRLQGGYNPKDHFPLDIEKTRDVGFIGSLRPERQPFRNAYRFDVLTGLYGKDHSRAVSETKINLSFSKGKGISNRIYKIMAAGGFVLSQPWETCIEDFEVNKELILFSSPEDMKKKIKYYLEHDREREVIAKAGCEKVKEYNHINYARKIVGRINNG